MNEQTGDRAWMNSPSWAPMRDKWIEATKRENEAARQEMRDTYYADDIETLALDTFGMTY